MSAITLEAIEAKQTQLSAHHAELSTLIEKFKQQPKAKTLTLPAVELSLRPGERYAGAMLKEDGSVDYHLAAIAISDKDRNHAGQVAWGESLGGEIADLREIRLLQANVPDMLPKSGWCWLKDPYMPEKHGASCAGYCNFYSGYFTFSHRSSEGAAVAVRRFNP